MLTPGFPKNEADTTCIPALQIYIKALKEISGYQISIISLHYPKTKGIYFWENIPVYTMGSSSFLTKIGLWQKVFRTLKQIHRENPITVLHSFWLGECAFIGHWFSKKNNTKHISTLMGQDALKENLYSKILPLKKIHLITLSNFQRNTFNKNYNVQTEVIPWGIAQENFHHFPKKTIDIIGVGSLTPLKNYDLFIDVIYQINQSKPIKAVLIGEGNLREKLQEKIRFLQLEKVIDIKGELNYDETLKYISQSKILLHTSNYESFGLVFAEALQSKTMIVSKEVGCAFSSPNWVISNNESEMITACENLLLKSFTEAAKNPFTIEKTVQHYLEIYKQEN